MQGWYRCQANRHQGNMEFYMASGNLRTTFI